MEDQYPRINNGIQHEGLERSSIVLGLIEQVFGFYDTDISFEENRENVHPSIWNKECGLLLSTATAALAQLYQKIGRSEEHTSELQSRPHLVCRLLLEKKNTKQ